MWEASYTDGNAPDVTSRTTMHRVLPMRSADHVEEPCISKGLLRDSREKAVELPLQVPPNFWIKSL